MDNVKTKIAIVSYSLGTGGAERFAGELSFMLESLEYEVHHIIVNNVVEFSFSGKLYNLGKLCAASFWCTKKIRKGILLKNYLKKEGIDIIIDNRTRNLFLRDWMTSLIYGKRRIYYLVHSYHLHNYLPKSVFLVQQLYQKAARIVCVSKEIEHEVQKKYGLKNTTVIHNPINSIPGNTQSTAVFSQKYVLFYGRLEDKVKNFGLLLNAFSQSKIYEQGIQLVIMGNGSSKALILNLIKELQLINHVTLIPFQEDPFSYVKQAKFTVLTSHYEGFPMAIIESLSLGTPVISVDCNSGPKEVIRHEFNGLLVENHNTEALSIAMKRFIDEVDLYQFCKENAIESVSHLSREKIAKQWESLLAE